MKKALVLVLIFCATQLVKGSHEIGGEVRLSFLGGNSYQVTILSYYDYSGTTVPPSQQLQLNIYSRANPGQLLNSVSVPVTSIDSSTSYPCGTTIYDFATAVYVDTLTLSPAAYNDPAGYLVVVEKPPGATHPNTSNPVLQHYSLIPPVVDQSANPIINSSPIPNNEFETVIICIDEDFSLDISASDPDGDSLAYRFFTPSGGGSITNGMVNGISSPYSYPPTQFNQIAWAPGYSETNQINGTSPAVLGNMLNVDEVSGELTVRPINAPGIFLVATSIEEYRDINNDGIKELIGSVYRVLGFNVLPCPWYTNSPADLTILDTISGDLIGSPCYALPSIGKDSFAVCADVATEFFFSLADTDSLNSYEIEVDGIGGVVVDSIFTKVNPSDTFVGQIIITPDTNNLGAIHEIKVRFLDQHRCGKVIRDSLSFWVQTVIIESLELENDVQYEVYPIPAIDKITINSKIGGQIRIYNINGRLVKSIATDIGINSISISEIENGVYILDLNGIRKKLLINSNY